MAYKKLSEATLVESISDVANVLIEENDEIKRVPKSELGVAEYLPSEEPDMIIELTEETGFYTSNNLKDYFQIVSGNVAEIRSKLEKGEPVNAIIIGDAMFVSQAPSSIILRSMSVAELPDYLVFGFIVITVSGTYVLNLQIDNNNCIKSVFSTSV